jgi:hypothetical protein
VKKEFAPHISGIMAEDLLFQKMFAAATKSDVVTCSRYTAALSSSYSAVAFVCGLNVPAAVEHR